MVITDKVWNDYVAALRVVNEAAASEMFAYLSSHEWWASNEAKQAAIEYAYALATKYGEAASELACEMYAAVSALSGENIEPPEPAPTATMPEVAKAVTGTMKTENPDIISGAVSRLVKLAAVDTTMRNALRDGAEWAWIPRGDTCAFCLMLASNGWQYASRKAIKDGHAEHVHANCDCTYAVRFNSRTEVEGYNNGEAFLEFYDNADGKDWHTKLNSMRREMYAANKANKLPEQLLDSTIAEEIDVT